jgi:hypothetical protein
MLRYRFGKVSWEQQIQITYLEKPRCRGLAADIFGGAIRFAQKIACDLRLSIAKSNLCPSRHSSTHRRGATCGSGLAICGGRFGNSQRQRLVITGDFSRDTARFLLLTMCERDLEIVTRAPMAVCVKRDISGVAIFQKSPFLQSVLARQPALCASQR